MQDKKQISLCSDHLARLYEDIKNGNLEDLKKIEHKLTPTEECVACTYLLKANGTVKEAFENYLAKEGIRVKEDKESNVNFTLTTNLRLMGTLVFLGLGLALITLVNYQIIEGWLNKNGPANIGSIEVSYVSMARFFLDFNFPNFAPLWYLGFPFHNFYTPLLPFLEVLLNKFFAVPLWTSYRDLTGFSFIAGPLTVVFLGWFLSRSIFAGVLSGMLYSVIPSILYFVVPNGEVFADRFTQSFFDPRRFTVLVRWGEGPHLFSLMFVPLVGVFYGLFLFKQKYIYFLLTCIFFGLAALTNAIGLFSSILLVGVMSFVFSAQNKSSRLLSLIDLVLVGAVTLGLVSFWYNLTFIGTFFKEGAGTGNLLLSFFPWGLVAGVGAIILLYLFIAKYVKDFGFAVALLWFLIFFFVVYFYYTSAGPDESYRRIELLPQALRYAIETDLSLSVLIAVALALLFRLASKIKPFFGILGAIVISLFALWLYVYIQPFLNSSAIFSRQVTDPKTQSVYKISQWFSENTDVKKGERVVAPGNYGFYLNWFTNVWQLRGALFQASTNFWPEHIYYQLANGESSEIAKNWLKAINAKYMLVTTPGSSELYKDIKNPERFESLKKVYDKSGDTIYETDLKNSSPVKIVNINTLKDLKPPKKADDKENLEKYVNWIEEKDSAGVLFDAHSSDSYTLTGNVLNGEGVLVQMTGGSGWSVFDKQKNSGVSIKQDPLGFMVLTPNSGSFNIELKRGVSWQEWLGYLITLITFVAILSYPFFKDKIKTRYSQG